MKTIAQPNALKFLPIMVWFESYNEDFLKGIYDSFNEAMKISLTVDKYRIFPNDPDHHGRSLGNQFNITMSQLHFKKQTRLWSHRAASLTAGYPTWLELTLVPQHPSPSAPQQTNESLQ
ncbi:hypothetical protein CDAR_504511 [Caerostris darwini]|uniref:Uncharacterized protein n=1 Tax=Caerostris darwini TaxID=1538125 RepID=A0AAV4S9B0_9ARAC|nr:hypothetical protein CDAR_504511 [Caerostris darwini]